MIYRCFLAVDLLICTFLPKISEYGGMSFCCWLVELKKIYFTNSKISYTGVFLSVDLLNWAILPKNAECGGISFCCWLVELRNNRFHQLKNFTYRCFFWLLTCWIELSCLKFLNVRVCRFAVDLLNWRKKLFSPTQKFHI